MLATRKLTVVLLLGTLVPAGCARTADPAADTPVAASGPAAAVAAVPSIDPAHPRRGPARAAVGEPFSFDLYAHCGGGYATFAGRTWKADNPPGNLLPKPDPAGITKVTGYVTGTMTLISADRAEFTIDPAGVVDGPEAPVVFRAVDEPAPLCK